MKRRTKKRRRTKGRRTRTMMMTMMRTMMKMRMWMIGKALILSRTGPGREGARATATTVS